MFQQDINLGPGTGTFINHSMEILVMLLGAFLLGLWLGWVLWNRYKKEADSLRLENGNLQATINMLQAELGNLKTRFTAVDTERATLSEQSVQLRSDNADLQLKVLTLGQTVEALESENRSLSTALNLNEGEATTIEEIASEPAVETIAEAREMAELHAEVPSDLLTEPSVAPALDLTLDMHTPQATITVEESDDFIPVMEDPETATAATRNVALPLQDDDHFSDAAFESFTRSALTAPVEEASADLNAGVVLSPIHQDDLKIVEGIGPKIEELLFKAGIHTYSELAAAPVSRLKEILAEAGSRYAMHDPGTWSAQALLAANNEWDNLKAYQEFLDAGKRPGK